MRILIKKIIKKNKLEYLDIISIMKET
mgnify:CR=1